MVDIAAAVTTIDIWYGMSPWPAITGTSIVVSDLFVTANHLKIVDKRRVHLRMPDLELVPWALGFSGDHQQTQPCLCRPILCILFMYAVLHCLYSVGNKITTTTATTKLNCRDLTAWHGTRIKVYEYEALFETWKGRMTMMKNNKMCKMIYVHKSIYLYYI